MTLSKLYKAPFPWFGGKSDAAPGIWAALGDVNHYVEPFAGSLAVLMRRPHLANRAYHSETVNDLDGLLVNAWRSIQMSPDATAEAASWPVSEADMHARHLALLRWRDERQLEHLMGDPLYHDPVMAGWWMWGQSSWIGSGWCSGQGPWVVDDDGRIFKRARGHSGSGGVKRQRPHLTGNGQGVNTASAREPGVGRQLPHISDNGQGVNTASAREPGVNRKLPHISDDGRGVNKPQAREPGVAVESEYHPMTMPEIRRWMHYLSARLRHVRILNGDWKRACTGGAINSLSVRSGKKGSAGVFLDPPYSAEAGRAECYAVEDFSVAHDVRRWCLENGDQEKWRIVLAGFEGEGHEELERNGWRVVEWYRSGFLKGGMSNTSQGGSKTQQKRERLWLSPRCLTDEVASAATDVDDVDTGDKAQGRLF